MTAISVLCLCVTVFVLRAQIQRLEKRISDLEVKQSLKRSAGEQDSPSRIYSN